MLAGIPIVAPDGALSASTGKDGGSTGVLVPAIDGSDLVIGVAFDGNGQTLTEIARGAVDAVLVGHHGDRCSEGLMVGVLDEVVAVGEPVFALPIAGSVPAHCVSLPQRASSVLEVDHIRLATNAVIVVDVGGGGGTDAH